MPSASAAPWLRSITRLWENGPRSLMRTTTALPVTELRTHTRVPNASVRCAAVRSWLSKRSPLAVRRPWKRGPYQEASPCWSLSRGGDSS